MTDELLERLQKLSDRIREMTAEKQAKNAKVRADLAFLKQWCAERGLDPWEGSPWEGKNSPHNTHGAAVEEVD
ncbi:MAG: hypothetical protein KME42_13975 [Tildeniella nuda ZEHNDER 1965/U140]|jgi:hypothetical protein|nr:hypothetical protein [Tildeniella nuda ZEHNDER 1965/U140]